MDGFNLRKRLEEFNINHIKFIAKNEYWEPVKEIIYEYENCFYEFIAGGNYKEKYKEYKNLSEHNDFIINYSTEPFIEDEINCIIEEASTSSSKKNKRVSIGYSYLVSCNSDLKREVKILSIKDKEIYEYTFVVEGDLSPLELIDMVIEKHNELEKENVKTLGKDLNNNK